MKQFIMRLLYSLYCAERWSYRVPMRILEPFINRVAKLLYDWNPFGYIWKNNPTLEHYIKHVHKTMDTVFYDPNIGMCITRAEGVLLSVFLPYEMLVFSVIKKLGILPIQSSYFMIFLMISCGLSILFIYFMNLDDEYLGYFHKFEKKKNNAVWHVISSIFFIGSICACLICIMWWNES